MRRVHVAGRPALPLHHAKSTAFDYDEHLTSLVIREALTGVLLIWASLALPTDTDVPDTIRQPYTQFAT